MKTMIFRLLILQIVSVLSFVAYAGDVYVSAAGSDSNAGTKTAPVKTVAKAKKLNATRILLRCGDTFYENINVDGIDVTSYGNGSKPVVCGLKILGKNAWVRGVVENGRWKKSSKGNVWRANLALDKTNYTGMQLGGSFTANSIGQIVNVKTDDMNNCRRVRYITDLSTDYDFWQGLEDYPDSLNCAAAYNYIYLYSKNNPNRLTLGLAVHCNGIQAQNCKISNLKVAHWGRHGIAGGSNVTIDNCEIDGIGGSFPITPKNWVLLGNGIEFYMNPPCIENSTVTNCTITRCFDAGLTLQGGSSSSPVCGRNVVFKNNTLNNCCQSFEFFLRGISGDDVFHDCVVSNNISCNAGIDTGFRYYDNRYKRCHVLENSVTRKTGIQYVNNKFVNGNYYCSGKGNDGLYDCPVWKGNVCYILRGQDLMGDYNGKKDVVTVPTNAGDYISLDAATEAAIEKYRSLTDDSTTKFVICDSVQDFYKLTFYKK